MSERDDHTFDFLKPYDDSMWDHFNIYDNIYDNIPYRWDSNCEKRLTLVSGNLIKSYNCTIKKQPYVIKH